MRIPVQAGHLSDGEFVCNAQKVKTDQCHCNSSPDEFAAFFAKKQTDDRYNYDITGGNKSGFSDSGVFNAELLEVACQTKADSAGNTADDQVFSFPDAGYSAVG